MPQSHCHVVLHIVFSTKNRQKLITRPHREPLHSLLAARVRELGCECYRVGGVDDHVHLAVRLGSKMTVAHLIEKIKVPTSIWMKRRAPSLSHFSWQNGYGAFSVSPPYLDDLLHYIDHQEAHHACSSFEEELRGFFRRYQVAYDERYVWD